MKKIFVLTACVFIFLTGMAQIRAYQPWDSATATGPLNFMTLDVQNHPYIRLNYNESYSSGVDNFEVSTATGPNSHHQLITTNGSDPCRCYNTTGSTYIHENYFPTTDIITKPNGAPVDTVIRLGSTSLTKNINKTSNAFKNITYKTFKYILLFIIFPPSIYSTRKSHIRTTYSKTKFISCNSSFSLAIKR